MSLEALKMYCVMRASVPSLHNVYRRYDDLHSTLFMSLWIHYCHGSYSLTEHNIYTLRVSSYLVTHMHRVLMYVDYKRICVKLPAQQYKPDSILHKIRHLTIRLLTFKHPKECPSSTSAHSANSSSTISSSVSLAFQFSGLI